MPDDNKPTRQELHAEYQELYNLVRQAYWDAKEIETKDKLLKLKEAISDILTGLNRADLESRTPEFEALNNSTTAVNANLDALKKEIDTFVHDVKLASQIVSRIDKVIGLAAKFFMP